VILLLLVTNALAAPPDVQAYVAQAAAVDAASASAVPAALQDDVYLVALPDALAAVARELTASPGLVLVDGERLGSDWAYDGAITIDDQGEALRQTRTRTEVLVRKNGAEVQLDGTVFSETRLVRPKAPDTPWVPSEAPLPDHGPLQDALGALERTELLGMRVRTPEGLADLEQALPAGFTVVAHDDKSLTAERLTTVSDRNLFGTKWARWEHREQLHAEADAIPGPLKVSFTNEHRFSTQADAGAWKPADAGQALLIDWLARAAKVGVPPERLGWGGTRAPALVARDRHLASPPHAPALRTYAEIARIIYDRAYELRSGSFTVCVDRILVNPTDPAGLPWDPPAGVDTEEAPAADPSAPWPSGVKGELNRRGERQRRTSALADGGMARIGAGIDGKQRDTIDELTKDWDDWVTGRKPDNPDISGHVTLGGTVAELDVPNDVLKVAPQQCGMVEFEANAPTAIGLQLWDADGRGESPIGTCEIPLGDVVDRGLTGIPCGFARVYASALFEFTYDQIDAVGLPPAE
jgi:hypothetical protein